MPKTFKRQTTHFKNNGLDIEIVADNKQVRTVYEGFPKATHELTLGWTNRVEGALYCMLIAIPRTLYVVRANIYRVWVYKGEKPLFSIAFNDNSKAVEVLKLEGYAMPAAEVVKHAVIELSDIARVRKIDHLNMNGMDKDLPRQSFIEAFQLVGTIGKTTSGQRITLDPEKVQAIIAPTALVKR